MSFVRNLFFSVFLGVWGTLSAREERVIPVPRKYSREQGGVPYIGSYGMAHQSEWSGEGKFSQLRGSRVIYGETRMARKRSYGQGCRIFSKISDAGIHPEGYVLEVKPEIVTVSASTATGLFYGLQSLLQLMKPDKREAGQFRR